MADPRPDADFDLFTIDLPVVTGIFRWTSRGQVGGHLSDAAVARLGQSASVPEGVRR